MLFITRRKCYTSISIFRKSCISRIYPTTICKLHITTTRSITNRPLSNRTSSHARRILIHVVRSRTILSNLLTLFSKFTPFTLSSSKSICPMLHPFRSLVSRSSPMIIKPSIHWINYINYTFIFSISCNIRKSQHSLLVF